MAQSFSIESRSLNSNNGNGSKNLKIKIVLSTQSYCHSSLLAKYASNLLVLGVPLK